MPLILYKSGVRLFIYRRLNILIRNYGLVFDGVYTTSSDIFFFFPPLISILIFFFFLFFDKYYFLLSTEWQQITLTITTTTETTTSIMTDIHLDQTRQKIPQPVKQLTFDELKAFPLPKAVETLPTSYLQDFSDNKQLLQGYIRQLEAYSTKQQEVVRTLQQADDILENVVYSQLIKDYEKVIDKINQQIKSINIIYQEFINLETYQYQLLSSNFNQDNLKAKFKKLIEENNQESLDIVKNFNDRSHGSEISDESFGTMIENFKNSRKLYHFRKEKLNRWEEERVSGFL